MSWSSLERKMKDTKRLIESARVALAVPGEKEFWQEVEERMEVRDAKDSRLSDLVQPRKTRD